MVSGASAVIEVHIGIALICSGLTLVVGVLFSMWELTDLKHELDELQCVSNKAQSSLAPYVLSQSEPSSSCSGLNHYEAKLELDPSRRERGE